MREEKSSFWKRGVEAVRKTRRHIIEGFDPVMIAAAINGEKAASMDNVDLSDRDISRGIVSSDTPAGILAATVADQAMGMSDRKVIREIPGIYQKFGTTVLPRNDEDRWKVIALSVNEHAEKFIERPQNFANIVGEKIPGRPHTLPPEVARHARERAVLEAADKWRPGKRLDHELHSQIERVSWRTNKMFAYGEAHEASVARQIREISRDDKQIASRVASVARYHDQNIPESPEAKSLWLKTAVSTEFAAIRLGMTGPKHPVDLAMRPECDHLEKDRIPDGMGRLQPDYSLAEARNATMDTQIDALHLASSTWSMPIPLCRTHSPLAPEPQIKMGEKSPGMVKLMKMQTPPRDMGMGMDMDI